MKKKNSLSLWKGFLFACFWTISLGIFAQNITVTGTVVDQQNEPVIGVTILIKGTSSGSVTDVGGKYTLFNVPSNAVLQISYVGMKSQEIIIAGRTTIDVVMESDTELLDELVVVGYGVMKKSDLTGSSSSIKEESLDKALVTTLGQALSGKAAGVNITSNSGRPGGRATIRIRGNSSISVTNDPLYVIDGVILNVSSLANGTSPLDYVNTNDIESIEILKDASATAIYGARGANGVLLITTKKGTGIGRSFRYDADFGVGILPKKLPVLNSAEFLANEELAYENSQKFDPIGWEQGAYSDPRLKRSDPRIFDSSGNPLYDTDWQDELYTPAFSQTHQLSLTNTKDDDSYGFSVGYRGEDGLMENSWLKRYSGRFYSDSKINKWLKVGGSLNYVFQDENLTDQLNQGGITASRQAIEAIPILPVKYSDGTWAGNNDYPGMEGGNNPIHVANERINKLETQSMLGNVYANIDLAEGLQFRSMFGANMITQKNSYYASKQLIWISAPNGSAYIDNNSNQSWQFENYLTYNKQFNKDHSFNGMMGLSWQHVNNNGSRASSSKFEDDFFEFNNLGVGVSPTVTSYANAYGLNSYFVRLNYNYKNKYLLTATSRIDGSSKFGESNRYAFFPSLGGAWRINEESFMGSLDGLSNLKLRASYGVTGNSETAPYASKGGLGNYTVVFGGTRFPGIGISTLENPDLKWEKTTQVNVGLDIGLFDSRVNIELDVYNKETTDMLLAAPVSASSGYTTITKNIGSMRNRGLEVSINTFNISNKDFSWETTFNISFNQNKVLSLSEGGDDIFPGPDMLSSTSNLIRVGEPVGSFYGYKRLGTWGTDEATEAARYGKLPGDLKLWDKNDDGQINDQDRIILGNGIPEGYGSFTNSFRYKNFDLLLDIQYMFGNDIIDISKHSAEDRTGIANSYKTVLNAWTPDNQDTMIAEIRLPGAGYTTNIDSHLVEDGSFLRGRNLVLGYTLPDKLIDKLNLQSIRLYGSVQNFFLLTDYSGFDPEISDATQTFAQGITVFEYPKPMTFLFGLNINF